MNTEYIKEQIETLADRRLANELRELLQGCFDGMACVEELDRSKRVFVSYTERAEEVLRRAGRPVFVESYIIETTFTDCQQAYSITRAIVTSEVIDAVRKGDK